MRTTPFSEDEIARFVAECKAAYGIEHTHDFECRTWRGFNWLGACDCTLRARQEAQR